MEEVLILVGDADIIKKARMDLGLNKRIYTVAEQNNWRDEFDDIIHGKCENGYSVIVCSSKYLDVGKILFDENISTFYVYLLGLLFKCDTNELMSPVELYSYNVYLKKNHKEKNIIYVGDSTMNNCNLAMHNMKTNYKRIRLCAGSVHTRENEFYDEYYAFTSMKGMQKFVENSEIDIVHCFPGTNVFANLFLIINIPLVYEMSADNIKNLDLVLEYNVHRYSSGIIYKDQNTKEIYENQFGIIKQPTIVFDFDKIADINTMKKHKEMERFYDDVRQYKRKTI